MRQAATITAVILGLLGAAPAQAIPACAGKVEIASARAVRVERNGVIVLSDGRALTLEGIRLPMGSADHAAALFADEARATMLSLARQGPLTAAAVPPKEDAYDRVRVQAFIGASTWLQQVLLERGLARVAIAPDRTECAAALYAFEAGARKARRGIWASSAYRIRTDRDDWRPDIGTFQVIEATLARVTAQDGAIVLDFGKDGKSGLVALVAAADRERFAGADLSRLKGRRIRLRGIVQESNGRPTIALSSPAQIALPDP